MMDINEKLSFFQELICCNYNVYLSRYQPDLTLEYTNCPPEFVTNDVLFFLHFADSLMEYATNGGCYPFILDTSLSLLWIAAFERECGELKKIHLIGPAFTGKNSLLLLRQELDQRNLSVKLRAKIFQQIENIPIIPTTTLYQYAVMMHHCITGERITTHEIQFSKDPEKDTAADIKLISEEHRGIWMTEQNLLSMIENGNPDYKAALDKSMSLSNGIKFDIGNPLRQQKNSVHALLTLCSRAAIKGGLNPSISYTLSDYYTQHIELSETTSELSSLCRMLLDDYVGRVRQVKEDSDTSKQIRNACDYIKIHITERLTIKQLAKQAGYTEYYFSQKFSKEVGCSVNEYILKEKIEHAKLLLSASQMSIQEISESLAFNSRSYFSTTFRKHTGLSPNDYREQNLKL